MTGSSGVNRYQGRAPTTRSPGAPVGAGRDVAGTEWDGRVLDLSQTAPELPDLGGAVVGEMLRAVPGVHRSSGTYTRRRVGWRASRGGIVLVRATQRLLPRPDGKFGPDGDWRPKTRVLRPVDPPGRRVGEVPVDRNAGTAADDASASTRASSGEFAEAEAQIAFLPAVVRRGLVQAVPQPTTFEAQALRYDTGASHHHRVVALRVDGMTAVAVSAALQQGATSWQVEQVTYRLSDGADRGAQVAGGHGSDTRLI